MKRSYLTIYILVLVLFLQSCKTDESEHTQINTEIIQNPISASGEVSKQGLPEISFDNTSHDFGLLIDGETVEYSFGFTNTGGSDLVITKVSASCGCTVPIYSKKPIEPGMKGEITVKFNSENRIGSQNKTIMVLSNSQPSLKELTITENIIRP